MEKGEGDLKLLSVFSGVFVTCLLLAQILSSAKFLSLGPLIMPAGTIVFPISFIFGDILTEVYGYNRSRKVIWTGLLCLIISSIIIWIASILPSAPFWHNQEAFEAIFHFVPRVTLAGLAAYFLGEISNSIVLSKMKYVEKGKRGLKQAWRFILSTIVGEGVDSIVFMTIAFGGVLSLPDMLKTIGGIYIFKVVYEIIITPFSTRFADWVKKAEGLDQIDYPAQTNYNPFAVFKTK